jgi:4-aminobutyrate aminotransferase
VCSSDLIDFIESEELVAHAEKLGRYALDRLHALMTTHPLIGDVRGQGLLFGAELVQNRNSKIPAEMEADQIMYACLKRGLSFKVSQGNFLTLTPPLTVLRSELDQAFDTLDSTLSEAENEAGQE